MKEKELYAKTADEIRPLLKVINTIRSSSFIGQNMDKITRLVSDCLPEDDTFCDLYEAGETLYEYDNEEEGSNHEIFKVEIEIINFLYYFLDKDVYLKCENCFKIFKTKAFDFLMTNWKNEIESFNSTSICEECD